MCPLPRADESVLMDLKALLIEAKQKVPPVLQVLQNGDETMLDIGGELFHKKMPLRLHLCLRPFFSLSLFLLIFFFFEHPQERGAAHFAVVWVIVSPTVQSWRPCRPNRSPTSDGKTTWLIVQWTSKVFFYCGGRSILALWLSHATCTSRSQRAAGAYFREILKC